MRNDRSGVLQYQQQYWKKYNRNWFFAQYRIEIDRLAKILYCHSTTRLTGPAVSPTSRLGQCHKDVRGMLLSACKNLLKISMSIAKVKDDFLAVSRWILCCYSNDVNGSVRSRMSRRNLSHLNMTATKKVLLSYWCIHYTKMLSILTPTLTKWKHKSSPNSPALFCSGRS